MVYPARAVCRLARADDTADARVQVRMSDENARRMRILQALGLIKLANNAVHFIADPA